MAESVPIPRRAFLLGAAATPAFAGAAESAFLPPDVDAAMARAAEAMLRLATMLAPAGFEANEVHIGHHGGETTITVRAWQGHRMARYRLDPQTGAQGWRDMTPTTTRQEG